MQYSRKMRNTKCHILFLLLVCFSAIIVVAEKQPPKGTESTTELPSTEPNSELPSTEPNSELPSTEPNTESQTTETTTELQTTETNTESQTTETNTESQTTETNTESQTTETNTESQTTETNTESQTTELTTEPQVITLRPEPQITPLRPEPQTQESATESQITPSTTEPQITPLKPEPQTQESTTESQTTELTTELPSTEPNTESQTTETTTEPQVITLRPEPQITPLRPEPQTQESATESQITPSTTEPQITPLKPEPQTQESATESQITPSTTEPQITPLRPEPQTQESATESQITPSTTESQITPSTTESQITQSATSPPMESTTEAASTTMAPTTSDPESSLVYCSFDALTGNWWSTMWGSVDVSKSELTIPATKGMPVDFHCATDSTIGDFLILGQKISKEDDTRLYSCMRFVKLNNHHYEVQIRTKRSAGAGGYPMVTLWSNNTYDKRTLTSKLCNAPLDKMLTGRLIRKGCEKEAAISCGSKIRKNVYNVTFSSGSLQNSCPGGAKAAICSGDSIYIDYDPCIKLSGNETELCLASSNDGVTVFKKEGFFCLNVSRITDLQYKLTYEDRACGTETWMGGAPSPLVAGSTFLSRDNGNGECDSGFINVPCTLLTLILVTIISTVISRDIL